MTMAEPSRPESGGNELEGTMAAWPTGRLLSTAARLVEHAWVDALAEIGLTHAGLIALHLLNVGSLSQTELARRARVETQTMSRTLERLEREGYVAREADARDRRRHVVTRTPAGSAAWESARTLEADLFPPLIDHATIRRALLDIISAAASQRWAEEPRDPRGPTAGNLGKRNAKETADEQ